MIASFNTACDVQRLRSFWTRSHTFKYEKQKKTFKNVCYVACFSFSDIKTENDKLSLKTESSGPFFRFGELFWHILETEGFIRTLSVEIGFSPLGCGDRRIAERSDWDGKRALITARI